MRLSYAKIIECDDGLDRLAVCDLSPICENAYMLNRICVPEAIRGHGVGRMIMEEMLDDADRTKSLIMLTVNAYGRPQDPSQRGLEEWYARCGFTNRQGIWVRTPQDRAVPHDFSLGQDRPGRIKRSGLHPVVGRV